MSNVLDTGEAFIMIDGSLVERDALHIAERIHDYDDNLSVACLDPDKAGVNDAPFLVLETLTNGTSVIAFEAWALDERLLERIYNADKRRVDSLELIGEMMRKKKKSDECRYQEIREINKDIVKHVIQSPKNSYTLVNPVGDQIIINEEGPVTVNKNKKSFGPVKKNKRYTPPSKIL